jgi:hypothetical protein
MQVRDGELPRARQLARTGKELSREARTRLEWMDYHRRCDNVALTCRHFGISRQIFYRWQKRYDAQNLSTLESRSHRPHRRRQPTWSPASAERVLALRRQFPTGARTSSPSCSAASSDRFRYPWWDASFAS